MALGFAAWSPDGQDVDRGSQATSLDKDASAGEISARVRVVQRLAQQGRFNEANAEAQKLMQRAPLFSVRRWVTDAYEGIRREDEREENIRLLVSVGLPEHAQVR